MSGMDFALKHAGNGYTVPQRYLPEEMIRDMYSDYSYYVQLVGYFAPDDDRVVVEFDDKSWRKHCWLLHDGVQLVIDKKNLYNNKEIRLFAINYKHLKDSNCYDKCEDEPAKLPPLYTSHCKKCGQPSRKYGSLTVCSNSSCDTRGKLKKSLNIHRVKTEAVRCPLPGRMIGEEYNACDKKAVFVRSNPREEGTWTFTCEMGHKFLKSTAELKQNDVVLFTLSGHDSNDRIWDGKSWQTF
jgi:hypothetical protein